jgi:hypothetical protein
VNIPTNDVDCSLGDLIIRGLVLVGITYLDILSDGMDTFDAVNRSNRSNLFRIAVDVPA